MKYDIASHLLPLEGALNARDLGNYPVARQRRTKSDIFFRSDSTSKYSKNDIAFLADKNLGLVVDLRSEQEVANAPSVFADIKSVRYENVPMLDDLNSGLQSGVLPLSMGAIYIHLLDSAKVGFSRIFNAFAETLERGQSCLFHCAVGKDRTGTTAMLLLDLVGASNEVIIQDYAATYGFMKPVFDKQMAEFRDKGYDIPEYMFYSDASNMVETLKHLLDTYESARDYLLDCGVKQKQLDIIIDTFVV